jgi:multiple sugar transport system permease protein
VAFDQHVLAIHRPMATDRRPPPAWHRHLRGSELTWAVAFVVPYLAVFIAFVAYPMAYALWMGANPTLYAKLLDDPRFVRAAVNTLVYVGIAVNLKMLCALLLSGFFSRPRRWIKALLVIYILPWTLPAIPAYLSFHWMMISDQGLLNSALWELFGINGPGWFNTRWLAVISNVIAYVWKWMPLWTLIFLAGRMAISQDLYDAADIDGASPFQRFRLITVPLVANLYLISTLISTIWTIGDFTAVFIVSGGGPAMNSDVLATIGQQLATDSGSPQLGVAAGLSALPLLLPVVILLMRRLRNEEVQL